MVEINPNEVLKHRPFNLSQFRQGAPVGVRGSKDVSVRILCVDAEIGTPIIALIRENSNVAKEKVYNFYADGKRYPDGQKGHYDLVMAAVGNIDGNDVYWGDKVYHRRSGAMQEIGRNWPGSAAALILKDYSMEPPTIEFKGRQLGHRDVLWYKAPSEESWKKVSMMDHWISTRADGIDTTHYGRVKSNLQSPHLLECYSWDFPLEVKVEGKKLEIGERIWYKHSPSEEGLVVCETFIDLVSRDKITRKAITRRPWIKKSSWQAEVKADLEDVESDPILIGPIYATQQECIEKSKDMFPAGYTFLAAKEVQPYYM